MSAERGEEQVDMTEVPVSPPGRKGSTCTERPTIPGTAWSPRVSTRNSESRCSHPRFVEGETEAPPTDVTCPRSNSCPAQRASPSGSGCTARLLLAVVLPQGFHRLSPAASMTNYSICQHCSLFRCADARPFRTANKEQVALAMILGGMFFWAPRSSGVVGHLWTSLSSDFYPYSDSHGQDLKYAEGSLEFQN